MIHFDSDGSDQAEVDYICIAADLLRRMMSELQSAIAGNARRGFAMVSEEHGLSQRLHSLLCTVELLSMAESPAQAGDLARHAKAMIFQLANELEDLALQAERDLTQSFVLIRPFEFLNQAPRDWRFEVGRKCRDSKITQTSTVIEAILVL
jgi:hypothetical protein